MPRHLSIILAFNAVGGYLSRLGATKSRLCNKISFMQQNLIPEKMQLDLVFELVPIVLEILTQLNLLDYYAITNFKYM